MQAKTVQQWSFGSFKIDALRPNKITTGGWVGSLHFITARHGVNENIYY